MALLADVKDVFGTISPPPALQKFIGTDPTGSVGISKFLTNLVSLFYIVGGIALIFMLLWGAFDWIVSEGEKEKIHAAQQKIFNAVIGLILFAVAFAVISVLGTFTGFKFFEGQGVSTNTGGLTNSFTCADGTVVVGVSDKVTACKGHP